MREGDSLKLYVDGRLVATQNGVRKLDVSNDAPLWIGFGLQSHFAGKIREVRLYNRALAEEEIKAMPTMLAAPTRNATGGF